MKEEKAAAATQDGPSDAPKTTEGGTAVSTNGSATMNGHAASNGDDVEPPAKKLRAESGVAVVVPDADDEDVEDADEQGDEDEGAEDEDAEDGEDEEEEDRQDEVVMDDVEEEADGAETGGMRDEALDDPDSD